MSVALHALVVALVVGLEVTLLVVVVLVVSAVWFRFMDREEREHQKFCDDVHRAERRRTG